MITDYATRALDLLEIPDIPKKRLSRFRQWILGNNYKYEIDKEGVRVYFTVANDIEISKRILHADILCYQKKFKDIISTVGQARQKIAYNHYCRDFDLDKSFHIYFNTKNLYVNYKYEVNTSTDDILIESAKQLSELILERAKTNGTVLVEKISFIPAGVAIKDILASCKILLEKARSDRYIYGGNFQAYDYPYISMIWKDIPIYPLNTDEKLLKKLEFLAKVNEYEYAYLRYKKQYPEQCSKSREKYKEIYTIEEDLKKEVYNIDTFLKTKTRKDFIQAANEAGYTI